jgi:hypothetical protein
VINPKCLPDYIIMEDIRVGTELTVPCIMVENSKVDIDKTVKAS